LKKIFTGGAPVFPNEGTLYKKAFPEAEIKIVYGSTEAEPISSISVENLIKEGKNNLQKGLIVGIPYHKTDVKIIRINSGAISCKNEKEFQLLILPPGKIGEIIVSGPHVLREYINNEKGLKQNKIIVGKDCWHRTGDSGLLQDSKLYLTGRCNTLINSGDSFISPFIYENQFQSISGIEMGTIMKINNKLIAIVETNKNAKHAVIKQQINSMEIHFDEIKILSKIPRDPRHNSKIDYELLKSMLKTM
jgi:acyl-CoA synthetase (AMP-forming)/AMP-acid ligase II